MIAFKGSNIASRTSWLVMVIVFGSPATMSRPFTSIVVSFPRGKADPIRNLISSAVRSPIMRLYARFM